MRTFEQIRRHLHTAGFRVTLEEDRLACVELSLENGQRHQSIFLAEIDDEYGRPFLRVSTAIGAADGIDARQALAFNWESRVGYLAIGDLDGTLAEFDRIVGLDRVAVVHINDTKNPRGSGKDRHAPVGAGFLGHEAINNIVHHELLAGRPFILETPWIGKDDKTCRPMYEAEIALLRGDAMDRFGEGFFDHVERLHHFFEKEEIDRRAYVLSVWDALKNDAKAKKADPREPMDRLYDLVVENRILPEDLSEEKINQRITAWFAGRQLLVNA